MAADHSQRTTVHPQLTFHSDSLADTAALGGALAEVLPDGAVVALSGTLGAGKTRLVQAVAVACGVPEHDVTSPTFVLVNEYRGRRPIYHFDAYRVKDDDEFLQLGPDEYFESSGLTFVEWAERVTGCLPAERFEIRIEPTGDQARRFEIASVGPRYAGMIERLQAALASRASRVAERSG